MAGFGGRIGSLNLHSLTTAERAELNEALAQHGVLIAHGLRWDPDEQVELTRVFGEPDIHPVESIRLPGVPEIIELRVDLTDQVDLDDPASSDIVGDIVVHILGRRTEAQLKKAPDERASERHGLVVEPLPGCAYHLNPVEGV